MSVLINWNKVTELQSDVGADDFDEVVELFLSEVEDKLSELGQPGNSAEHDLHFLKGAALNLGFQQFSELCKTGEAAAAKGDSVEDSFGEIAQIYTESKMEFLDNLEARLAS